MLYSHLKADQDTSNNENQVLNQRVLNIHRIPQVLQHGLIQQF